MLASRRILREEKANNLQDLREIALIAHEKIKEIIQQMMGLHLKPLADPIQLPKKQETVSKRCRVSI